MTKLTTKQRELICALPPLDGVSASDMDITDVKKVPQKIERVKGRSQPSRMQTMVTLRHPMHSEIAAFISDGTAHWQYLGEKCEVNGVVYSDLSAARRVREALAAEGIAHHYPGTPQARAALRKHGIERTPNPGEEWGCGIEFGVVLAFTEDSRAVIRQTKPGGIVNVGETFELPIHVLSPVYLYGC